jgi:hypothetical protein
MAQLTWIARTHKPEVAGSNPARASKKPRRGADGLGFYRLQAVFFRRFSRLFSDFSDGWSEEESGPM